MNNETSNKIPDGYRLNKWVLLLSGILFTSIGISFLGSPSDALFIMILCLGFSKSISGIIGIITSIKKQIPTRKWGLLTGIIDLIFGIALISFEFFKIAIILVAPFIIAAWALCRGTVMIIRSIKIRNMYKFWIISFILGIISIIFAGIILSVPYLSLLGFVDSMCIFLIFMGISLIIQFILLLFTDNKK